MQTQAGQPTPPLHPMRACSFPKSGVPSPVTGSQPVPAVKPYRGSAISDQRACVRACEQRGRTAEKSSTYVRAAAWVRAGRDIVEAGHASRVDDRVQEAQRRLALGQAEVVEQRDHACEGLGFAILSDGSHGRTSRITYGRRRARAADGGDTSADDDLEALALSSDIRVSPAGGAARRISRRGIYNAIFTPLT